jgi:hypothetical protein
VGRSGKLDDLEAAAFDFNSRIPLDIFNGHVTAAYINSVISPDDADLELPTETLIEESPSMPSPSRLPLESRIKTDATERRLKDTEPEPATKSMALKPRKSVSAWSTPLPLVIERFSRKERGTSFSIRAFHSPKAEDLGIHTRGSSLFSSPAYPPRPAARKNTPQRRPGNF